MPTSKELREKRMNLENQISALLDKVEAEDRGFTADEDAQYQNMFKDSQELLARAQRLEARDASMKDLADPKDQPIGNLDGNKMPKDQAFNLAVEGWCRGQIGVGYSEDHQAAAEICGFNLNANQLVIPLHNKRDYEQFKNQYRNAMTTGGIGSTVIPDSFVNRLEIALLSYSPLQNEAEVMRTENGQPMPWPTFNDTGNKGRQIGEAKSVNTTTITPGANIWYAHKFTSDELLIAEELTEDNAINLDQVAPDALGERLGRILNERYTTGPGNGTCYGIVPGAPVGKTAVAVNAITLDEVLDLRYSVQNPYRQIGKFMGNDKIFLAMRKLKNTPGDYLWQSSIQAGMPDVFDGSPIVPNNDMTDTMAASADVLIFGDLTKYKVRQVNQVRLYKLMERHREDDCTALVAFVRADGRILNAGGNPIKKLRMAAA